MSLRPLDPYGDDEPHAPPFNLGHQLMGERRFVAEFGEPRHVEVVTLAGDTVADVRTLAPGESFEVGPEVGWWRRLRYRDIPRRRRLVQVTREGAWVHMDGVCGTLVRDGQHQRLDVAGDVALLRPGDVVHLFDGDDTAHHIRFAPPPRRPKTRARRVTERMRAVCWPAWGASLAVHLIALVAIGVLVEPDAFHLRRHDPGCTLDIQFDHPPGVLGLLSRRSKPTPRAAAATATTTMTTASFGRDTALLTVKLGESGVLVQGPGELAVARVHAVMNAHRPEIFACYQCSLNASLPDGLSGELRLVFQITPAGRTKNVRVSYTNLGSSELVGCLVDTLSTWRFPPPEGGRVVVNYPFYFE